MNAHEEVDHSNGESDLRPYRWEGEERRGLDCAAYVDIHYHAEDSIKCGREALKDPCCL